MLVWVVACSVPGPSCSADLGEVVLVIPEEDLGCVLARQLADQAAMAVVEIALVLKHPHQVVTHIAALRQGSAALHCLLGSGILDIAGRVITKAFVGGL